jgi:hypothetical protein
MYTVYLVFIIVDAAKEKGKKKKVLLPAGVSKSAVYTVENLRAFPLLCCRSWRASRLRRTTGNAFGLISIIIDVTHRTDPGASFRLEQVHQRRLSLFFFFLFRLSRGFFSKTSESCFRR